MPYDANAVLQAVVTKTTAFNGTGFDQGGTPRRGLKVRVRVTDYGATATGAVWTPAVDHSDDNTTYTRLATGTPLTAATAAGTSLQFITVETSKRYIRGAVDLSVTTGAPSIIYKMELGVARP